MAWRVLLRPKRDVAGRVLLRPKRDVAGRVLLRPKRDVAGRLLLRPKRDVAGRVLRPKRVGAGRVAEAEESGAGQVAEANRERRERSRASCWLKEVEAVAPCKTVMPYLFHGCTQHPSLAQSASSIQSRGGRQVACRPVILPFTYSP